MRAGRRTGAEIAETSFCSRSVTVPISSEISDGHDPLQGGRGRAADRAHAPDPRPRGGKRSSRFSATRFTAARRRRAFFCTRRKLHSRIRPPGKPVTFRAPVNFWGWVRRVLITESKQLEPPHVGSCICGRGIEPEATNAFRVIHGASDGWPGWYVERLGDFLLSQSEQPLSADRTKNCRGSPKSFPRAARITKSCRVRCGARPRLEASPQLVSGEAAPERFEILENGVRYEMSFNEGYSVGLFLDQRDNRRRLLTGHIAADFPSSEPADSGLRTSELFRLHLRFLGLCGQGGRADDEPRSLEKISRMGPAQLRAERPRPGGARFHLRRHVRLAAAAGKKRPRV